MCLCSCRARCSRVAGRQRHTHALCRCGKLPLHYLAHSKQDAKTGITELLDAGADVAAADEYVMATLVAALHMKV